MKPGAGHDAAAAENGGDLTSGEAVPVVKEKHLALGFAQRGECGDQGATLLGLLERLLDGGRDGRGEGGHLLAEAGRAVLCPPVVGQTPSGRAEQPGAGLAREFVLTSPRNQEGLRGHVLDQIGIGARCHVPAYTPVVLVEDLGERLGRAIHDYYMSGRARS